MNERELRNLLLQHPLPDEHMAEERTWDVTRGAFAVREPVKRPRRIPWRTLLVLALAGGIIAVGLSSAGSTISNWVRDNVGREKVVRVPAPSALVKLPAPGRVLVVSNNGVWVVSQDGGRRFLGRYEGATWSPRGQYVAVWDAKQIVTLDPNVTSGFHWARPAPNILGVRWSPSGFRVAYVTGHALHVVVGNNTGDKVLAGSVALVPPAWRPGSEEVLAYADPSGRVNVVETDSVKTEWRTPVAPPPIALGWTDDGKQLVALAPHSLRVFTDPGKLAAAAEIPKSQGVATSLAVRSGSHDIAYSVYSPATGRGAVMLFDGKSSRELFSGAGRFDNLAWSPDGRLLLVPWRAADELLFVPAGRGRVVAYSSVASQFNHGTSGGGNFPQVDGWCCSAAFSRG